MGTFTDNLLKLTEFPFSYSLISLLALIFYGKSFLIQPIETGALLILMGFVATTLSITDPIGVLQRDLLRKGRLRRKVQNSKSSKTESSHSQGSQEVSEEELKQLEQHKPIATEDVEHLEELRVFGYKIDKEVLKYHSIAASLSYDFLKKYRADAEAPSDKSSEGVKKENQKKGDKINDADIEENYTSDVSRAVHRLINSTLKTKWLTREIDKITSMAYFLVVVGLFISVVSLAVGYPKAVDKFVFVLQGGNQSGGSTNQMEGSVGGGTTTDGNQSGGTSLTGYNLLTTIGILAFSVGAFIIVLIMLIKRLKELRRNALTAFQFLVTRLAYRIARRVEQKLDKGFQDDLDEVENRYMDSNDWGLAELWMGQLMQDYRDLFHRAFNSSSNKKNNIDGEAPTPAK
jgi:hypothetical protein